ncbi:MAG: alpha/beta hydrolase [Deltaproteobacteria bacterium]|nr:alpha/beta hydrolase [Deltaproteobacteria bacterium]MBW2413767.1 alpha/beta hydrolase [Deltaproteobacteria bacterium]
MEVPGSDGDVSGLWLRPHRARAALILAHGAGAGMRHAFMQSIAAALAERGVATLRFQFPYMEAGSRRPDRPAQATAAVRAAVGVCATLAPDLPRFAGGKSFGGRMTSTAEAQAPLGVRGIAFLGFPLHPARKPGVERAAHLDGVGVPMLFLQGTRDGLADLGLLRPVCDKLGPRARLHVVEGGDHSFHVLKRSGRSDEQVIEELADATARWTAGTDA